MAAAVTCPCGWTGRSLTHHLSNWRTPCQHSTESETLASSEAEAASLNDMYRERMRGIVFRDVAALYWHHLISETKMKLFREAVTRWVEAAVAQVETELAVRLGAPVAKVAASIVKQRFDFFDGLQTEKQTRAYAAHALPIIPAMTINHFGPAKHASGIMIVDWLTALLRFDATARANIIATSEKWKSGVCQGQPAMLSNIDDGAAFREHVFARADPDRPGEPPKIKVGLVISNDDFEILDPCKHNAGKKKLSGFYAGVANLPVEMRFTHSYLCPLTMVLSKTVDSEDLLRVFAGANADTGEILDDDTVSIGAQLRSLLDEAGSGGVLIKVYSCVFSVTR